MSKLPQHLNYIKFYNTGTPSNAKWWVEKEWIDNKGVVHNDKFKLCPDASAIIEYLYLERDLEIPAKLILED